MSIQDFNSQFGQKNDFHARKERALSNYYEGDIGKLASGPIHISNQEHQSMLNKNDSTYFIDTNLYIADVNNNEIFNTNNNS